VLHLFGIRHHGPGSSKRLIKALQQLQPDVILIEAPKEVEKILPYITDEELQPPVAALIYNPKELQQAVYYPFTAFAPEWLAFRYAQSTQTPIIPFDLPQSMSLGLQANPDFIKERIPNHQIDKELQAIAYDPIGYIARLAGYNDSERWWEVAFEQEDEAEEVFDKINFMMQALRAEIGPNEQPHNLIREAYMRKILRKTIRKGYEKVAIVCGAWHGPALTNYKDYKVKEDNALLKGIPKIKTTATWIPWTYQRIARTSGYGAGMLSPAWYQLLFEDKESATIKWMAKVAQLFKKEDLETSAAHAIEASRLADTLAALRGLALPGIDELKEAVVTIFSGGYESQLTLISDKLIIGDKMGQVPESLPIIPLQKDIKTQIKTLKLKKYQKAEKKWLKANSNRPKGGLDLRKDFDRKQSQFLHRLHLLGIAFGRKDAATGRELSNKNEYWEMEWQPDFAITIIEAGMWGNTVAQAANALTLQKASEANTLMQLTDLLQQILQANLPEALEEVVQELRNVAAITKDIHHLMRALPTLIHIHRYGDVRNTSIKMVSALVHEMVPRICISLPSTSTGIDEEASELLFGYILDVNQSLLLLNDEEFLEIWAQTLQLMVDISAVHPKIRGAASRILLDNQIWDIDHTAQLMSYELSSSVHIDQSGFWIEGFLHGNGLLLIHKPTLWQIIDQWVSQLKDEQFQALLPTLRRAFANFAPAARQKMLRLVKTGEVQQANRFDTTFDPKRMEAILPSLRLLLADEE